jgi:hypothetical protein
MARKGRTQTMSIETVDQDVDVDVTSDAEEEVTVEATTPAEKPAPKAKKEPKRGDLPENYITPVGLARVITERKLHTNRDGEIAELAPQMVYSYIKNAPKNDQFPFAKTTLEDGTEVDGIKDSVGALRPAAKLDEALAWWERKKARAGARKANAAEKASKKETKATEAPSESAVAEDEGVAVEAE